MTFAALLVMQKREEKKSSFMLIFAGEQCSPLQDKVGVQQTSKIKNTLFIPSA